MEKLIRPVFTLELNYKIIQGLVTVGKYDGSHPCITAATTADKVLIHSPHRKTSAVSGRVVWSESNREIATLNVNQNITALCAGRLFSNDDKDILIIGTPTHILAYHVHDNRDIFYKECQDGVKAITIGGFSNIKTPVVIIGCNSSVHGFDQAGNEVFWTAVSDVVTAVILCDFNKDGSNEDKTIWTLEDIRSFDSWNDKIVGKGSNMLKSEELLMKLGYCIYHVEICLILRRVNAMCLLVAHFHHQLNKNTESSQVINCSTAYRAALANINNSLGNVLKLIVSSEDFNIKVYKGDKIISENIETEIVTGLANLPESRFAYSVSNGTVGVYEQDIRLWRVKSKNFAISIYSYDLLGRGAVQLITGWSNGKIDCRSIKTGEVLFKDTLSHGIAGIVEADYRSVGKTDLICVSVEGEVRGYTTTKTLATSSGSPSEQDMVRELLAQKQTLLLELKHYENNTKVNEDGSYQDYNLDNMGVIPANTRLQIGISTNDDEKLKPHVEIALSTNNTTIIKAVIVFAEGIFKGETLVVHPPTSKLCSELLVPLFPPKDTPIDIHIKALVGYANFIQYHVFELTRQLPRFSMYCVLDKPPKVPQSYVQFKINERLQRICMWINQNFLLSTDIEFDTGSELKINMKCLRDNSVLILAFDISGKVTFYTQSMLLAGDLIQSLTAFLNVDTLESTAHFPEDEEKLKKFIENLSEIQDARLRLGTDVADRLGQIRSLIVLAEDSRINALDQMTKYYNELNVINKELINGYNIRLKNHQEGVDAMKTINSVIQRASRLRVGQQAANVITHCRTMIKSDNIESLIKIIQTGQP